MLADLLASCRKTAWNRMDIASLKQQFDRDLAAAASEADLRALRDKYLVAQERPDLGASEDGRAAAPADSAPGARPGAPTTSSSTSTRR